MAFIASILVLRSKLSLAQFGLKFFSSSDWDPVSGAFGALPFIYGTLATSFLALLIALTELRRQRSRRRSNV